MSTNEKREGEIKEEIERLQKLKAERQRRIEDLQKWIADAQEEQQKPSTGVERRERLGRNEQTYERYIQTYQQDIRIFDADIEAQRSALRDLTKAPQPSKQEFVPRREPEPAPPPRREPEPAPPPRREPEPAPPPRREPEPAPPPRRELEPAPPPRREPEPAPPPRREPEPAPPPRREPEPAPPPRREFEPAPPRQETITSKGGEINLKDEIGATLSIPRNSTAKDEQVNFSTGFSGSCEMPEGVESVSPAYLIKTTNEVEFNEPVDLTLQHTSYIQTAEDCKEMVFLKASITSHKDSDSRLKFEEIDNASAAVKFSPGEGYGSLILKKLSSWFKIGRKLLSGKKKERFYSARLYKAVTGSKVTAIFCMCLEHPLYTKHCDKVIPLEYPVKAKGKKKTIFNRVIINGDEVELVMKEETKTWTLSQDRSGISKMEVDYPDCEKIKLSELSDYPPRIVIDLTLTEQASAPAVLDVMGLKDNCCFNIVNDCVPNLPAEVDTQLLQDATKKLKTRISEDLDSDSPMVTCARDMVRIMTEVEQLVHDPSSINELVKKVVEIQEQIKNVTFEGVNDVENSTTKVYTISHQFKKVASVMQRCSAGNPELWTGAIEVLVPNATILMEAIAEVLNATEVATITRRGSSLSSLRQRSSSSTSQPKSPPPTAPKPRRVSISRPHSQDGRRPPPTQQDITFVTNDGGDKYELINNISGVWRKIGSHLGLTENQLDNIDTENRKQDQRFLAVMSKWIRNARGLPHASRYPHSWTGLHTLLADSGVAMYADEFIIFMEHVPIPDH